MASGYPIPSYFYSKNLYNNANNTALPTADTNNDTLTEWLQNSYNARIGTNDNILDLLSKLAHNSAFNPYDSIDNYIVGLENNPFGNMVNDTDSDYFMFTQNNADYQATPITNPSVKIDSDGYISPNSKTKLTDEVTSYLAGNPTLKIAGKNVVINASTSQADLVALYKQLSTELTGIKEYTLTNQEIIDMQTEINNLNGAGVKGNLEAKIAAAQKNLKSVLMAQLIKDERVVPSLQNIFRETDLREAENKVSTPVLQPISSVGTYYPTPFNEWYYVDADGATQHSSNGSDSVVTSYILKYNTDVIAKELLGDSDNDDANYDYVNNPFYQYTVALRTDDKLEMEKSFNEAVPLWNQNGDLIGKKDDATKWDPSKYTNIKEGDKQLGPVEILKNLYCTQELMALYKKYEGNQNKSNSMTLSLAVALQNSAEFDFRKALADAILAKITANDITNNTVSTVGISNEMTNIKTLQRGCSSGPTAQQSIKSTVPDFDGFYGDVNTVAKKLAKETGTSVSGKVLVDPYVVTINGTKYIFGQDGDSNGNIDDVSEILGINDSFDNPFTSLVSLDSNKDGMVSQEELLKNHIILKAVDAKGKLTTSSYDTDLLSGIDLSKLNRTQSGNVAGSFSLKLSNGSTVQGVQTFDDQSYFNTLFGKIVDLSGAQKTATSSAATTNSSTATSGTATTQAAQTTQSTATSSVSSISHQSLLDKINSAYSALIIDDTSNIETILDNVCWKHNVSLTSAQRIRIMDGIDPLLSAYEIERKVVVAVSNLNLSA